MGVWGQVIQCVLLSFSRKVKSLSGMGNTELIKKALTGGAPALAASGGHFILPQLGQPLWRLQPGMPREAPGLGWSPLADQAEQDIPEALGIPHSARGKKHGASSSPGTAQDQFSGKKKEISSPGSSRVLFTLSRNMTCGMGAEQH